MTIYAGLKALHLLFAVLWVGGMFFAYVVLRPSLAAIEAPQRMLLHTQVFRKFFLVIWHAMPIILITGFATAFADGLAVTEAAPRSIAANELRALLTELLEMME